MALLSGYLHDWLAEYAALAALGVGKDNMPEALFARMADDLDQPGPARPARGASRAEQIAAFVAAAGGE